MRSSEPLFTRQNPFKSSSRSGKTHYHPSCTQPLSKTEKKTALSPVRFKQPPGSHITSANPESQKLCGSQKSRSRVTEEWPVFTEAWPATTDCESSLASGSTPSPDMERIEYKVNSSKTTLFSEQGNWQESDRNRFTEHFRDCPPLRGEEQTDYSIDGQQLSFWQTPPSPGPPSSTPSKTADMEQSPIFSPAESDLHDKCLSPSRDLPSILSESDADDTEILHLQERANRLLLREECMNDASIRVSSEGLECTAYSSSASIDELQRRPLIPVKARSDLEPASSSQKSFVPPSLVTPQRPEEDILFQWRLRRKMEQAREGPRHVQHPFLLGPTFSWQSQTLSNPAANGPLFKHQQSTQPEYLCNSTLPYMTVSQSEPSTSCLKASGPCPVPAVVKSGCSDSQPVPSVPAHMHFLCDVLPCPIQSSHAGRQHVTSRDIAVFHVKANVPAKDLPEEPICERCPLSQPAPSEAKEGGGTSRHKRPERTKKDKVRTKDSDRVITTTKQKKSSVVREHMGASGPLSEGNSQERAPQQPEHRRKTRRRDVSNEAAAPPSPVHRVLGQVVSEVLFPSADSSSPAQRAPALPGSPARPSSVPPQSSGPPDDTMDSVEVIAQLLQEAEDSDEKEFEDDPLLQVLRKQRMWIREQIGQVDSVFNELLDAQKGTSTLMRDT